MYLFRENCQIYLNEDKIIIKKWDKRFVIKKKENLYEDVMKIISLCRKGCHNKNISQAFKSSDFRYINWILDFLLKNDLILKCDVDEYNKIATSQRQLFQYLLKNYRDPFQILYNINNTKIINNISNISINNFFNSVKCNYKNYTKEIYIYKLKFVDKDKLIKEMGRFLNDENLVLWIRFRGNDIIISKPKGSHVLDNAISYILGLDSESENESQSYRRIIENEVIYMIIKQLSYEGNLNFTHIKSDCSIVRKNIPTYSLAELTSNFYEVKQLNQQEIVDKLSLYIKNNEHIFKLLSPLDFKQNAYQLVKMILSLPKNGKLLEYYSGGSNYAEAVTNVVKEGLKDYLYKLSNYDGLIVVDYSEKKIELKWRIHYIENTLNNLTNIKVYKLNKMDLTKENQFLYSELSLVFKNLEMYYIDTIYNYGYCILYDSENKEFIYDYSLVPQNTFKNILINVLAYKENGLLNKWTKCINDSSEYKKYEINEKTLMERSFEDFISATNREINFELIHSYNFKIAAEFMNIGIFVRYYEFGEFNDEKNTSNQ